MAKIEKEILLEHEYDGIRELDNFLPPWWTWLFIITIVFSIGYVLNYHVLKTGDLQDVSYYKEVNPEWSEADLKMVGPGLRYTSPYAGSGGIASVAVASSGAANNVDAFESVTVALLTDNESMTKGKAVFDVNCVACHGANGEGLIGPNFCDTNWIHGGSIDDLVRIIRVGVPAKGMIPWDKTLTPDQVLQVASYILTLEGTSPPNQKAPEGEIFNRS